MLFILILILILNWLFIFSFQFNVAAALSENYIFAGMSEDDKTLIGSRMDIVNITKGETVIQQGENILKKNCKTVKLCFTITYITNLKINLLLI